MKTFSLAFVFLILNVVANAQWSINYHAGLHKTIGLGRERPDNSYISNNAIRASLSPLFGGYILTEKIQRVNFGVGITLKQNNIHTYINRTYFYTAGLTKLDIHHRSAFVSIHPVLDVNIDKGQYFHLLLSPNFNILLWGRENGYRTYSSGKTYYYDNSTTGLRKVVLGVSVQLQFQYPLTGKLKAMGALGYSINNTPGDYVPGESGDLSFQLGFKHALQFKGRDKASVRDEAKTK